MFEQLKQYLHQRKLKGYSATNIDQTRESHFQHVKLVGIVFDATDPGCYPAIERFQKRLGARDREVQLLGYVNRKNVEDAPPFDHFTASELNLALIPKSETAEAFIRTPFDILINLDPSGHAPLNYVCAASRALFKVGPATSNPAHYDLMIDIPGGFDLEKFIFEVRRTLNLIQ